MERIGHKWRNCNNCFGGALYFVIKWAVKSGMKEAYEEISGKEIKDDLDEVLEKEAEGKERKNSKR